ncbi:MAG: ATP-dependent DNA helicase RecG [Lentisphaeria bacterium]|jgi:ATP-dependent DNA helicase RecG
MPITMISGVGGKLASVLEKLDIRSIQDLLFHLPIRYMDRTRITAISRLQLNTSVVIQGRVLDSQIIMGRRRSMMVTLDDDTGSVSLRFYHFKAAQKNSFEAGRRVRCYGDPRLGTTGMEFYHPEYEFIDAGNEHLSAQSLTPVYALTDGISQTRMRKLAALGVAFLQEHSPTELLPKSINQIFGIESLGKAVEYVHFPPTDAPVFELMEGRHPYQQRLAFEELLAHFLARQHIRDAIQRERAPLIGGANNLIAKLLEALPFKLTSAQLRVIDEIQRDFAKNLPMLRMVQGDVGSGKTLVAAAAALQVASSGYQVAVVAPTEILAEQHLHSFTSWLQPLGIKVAWLVGKLTAAKRRDTLAAIAAGEAQVIVGTHALFQKDVEFARLGLAVIDEQHRFGVGQRLTLRKKSPSNETPHQLVMTATPIPRTLAMTAYSELDYSVIDELPPGRTPVNTVLISQKRRNDIIERVRAACEEGKQVFWVCPLVEESETLSAANAEQTAQLLTEALQGFAIGLIHGRMKSSEKEQVMADVKGGSIQLLVATTVIEVGVDVPNASLLIIENPERLGLAQLHQLRGRVGRGSAASHCVLLYGDKLSQQARERMRVLRETTDGFKIAERDLQLRGPGELLGTRQTGDMQYRLADAQRDAAMIPMVHEQGALIFNHNSAACEAIIERWIGKNKIYAQV